MKNASQVKVKNENQEKDNSHPSLLNQLEWERILIGVAKEGKLKKVIQYIDEIND